MSVKLKVHKDGPFKDKVYVHWLRICLNGEQGPIQTISRQAGPIVFGAAKFIHGCKPQSTVAHIDNGQFSGDPRAVNCPDCMKTKEFEAALAEQDDYE